MYYLFEPRSKDWYDDDETESDVTETSLTGSDILLFPVQLLVTFLLGFLITVVPLLLLIGYGISSIYSDTKTKVSGMRRAERILWLAWVLFVGALAYVLWFM